jgi:hypothetical protein
MGIISIILVSVLHHFPSWVFSWGFELGTSAGFLWNKFYLAPVHTPPPRRRPSVAPSVLQLVSERVRSLIVLNRLCDPKATWRKVMWISISSMVRILVTGKIGLATISKAKVVPFGRSYRKHTSSQQHLRIWPKVSCKGMRTTIKPWISLLLL